MEKSWYNLQYVSSRYRLHRPEMWQERLVVWGGAALSALVIVGFVRLTDVALGRLVWVQSHHFWFSLLLPPLGGMLIVYLARRFFAGCEGSGIPQVIACLSEHHREKPYQVVSLRVAFGKIMLGALAMLCGFSTGREGPCVQVSASMMLASEHLLPARSRVSANELLLAGGAAGIAAAFNTPLAGIIFAIEELARRFEQRTHAVLLTAIVIAGMVSISFQGNYLYFGHLVVHLLSISLVVPVLVCAVVTGIAGGLFSVSLLWTGRTFPQLHRVRRDHPVQFAALTGLGMSLLCLLSHGNASGSGYDVTRTMLMGGPDVAWYYAPFKWMATVLSFHSGVPGGIFAPSLAVGAGIGQDLQGLLGSADAQSTIYALCMAGFLAAVTQSPITSTIIVMEMIDGHQLVISLVAVTMLASIISRGFSPSLYHELSHRYELKGPAHRKEEPVDVEGTAA